MNSSSVPAIAVHPRDASRAVCAARICRGEATTGAPSSQVRSAITRTEPSCQGSRRRVDMSGAMTKSPYPRSQDDIAYPSTVFMSTSTASR